MPIVHVSFREESRKDYGRRMEPSDSMSTEQIRTGALLRIADATEKMAQNIGKLETDLAWYKKRYREGSESNKHLGNVIRGLRGALKRKGAR